MSDSADEVEVPCNFKSKKSYTKDKFKEKLRIRDGPEDDKKKEADKLKKKKAMVVYK